jgi:hypothetical protein
MRQVGIIFSVALVTFFAGLSSGLFLLPFWVQPFLTATEKGNPADWIGFAGNFAAGVMTLIAAALAFWAVQQQIQAQREGEARRIEIDIISREEERMEALLPGLEGALDLLIDLDNGFAIEGLRTALQSRGLLLSDINDLQSEIGKRLPTTDASTRFRIAQSLKSLVSCISDFDRAEYYMLNPDDLAERTPEKRVAAQWAVNAASNSVKSAKSDFDRLLKAIYDRANLFRERLPLFRARIEEYFG